MTSCLVLGILFFVAAGVACKLAWDLATVKGENNDLRNEIAVLRSGYYPDII